MGNGIAANYMMSAYLFLLTTKLSHSERDLFSQLLPRRSSKAVCYPCPQPTALSPFRSQHLPLALQQQPQ